MNSLFALFFKDVDNCLSFIIPYKYFFNKVVWATTFVRFLLLPHLSLQTSESPCSKGLEGSERAF